MTEPVVVFHSVTQMQPQKRWAALGFPSDGSTGGGGSAHTASYLYVYGARALRDVTPHTPDIILGLAVMQPSIHRIYFISKRKIPDLEGVYTAFYINPSHFIYLSILFIILSVNKSRKSSATAGYVVMTETRLLSVKSKPRCAEGSWLMKLTLNL